MWWNYVKSMFRSPSACEIPLMFDAPYFHGQAIIFLASATIFPPFSYDQGNVSWKNMMFQALPRRTWPRLLGFLRVSLLCALVFGSCQFLLLRRMDIWEGVRASYIYIYMLICCDFSKWCICFWYMFWYDLVCHMSNIIIIVVVLLLIVIVIIITVFVIHAPAPKWSWNQLFLCTQLPRPLSSPWAFLVVGPWLRTVPGVPRFSAPFQTIRNAFRNEPYMV